MPHDHEVDHVHLDDDGVAREHLHPLWLADRVELKSVGIDIGSSTTHLIFSTLEMRRQSAALSSRFELVKRVISYASPILLTPFKDRATIDVESLSAFFASAYAESGMNAEMVDTGAVITTGDAARKDNAASVIGMFAQQTGKFVCASAGPILEAKMAAYGSGAAALSMVAGRPPETVLNIDIGGGTSKLATCRDGRILDAAAINVGARILTFDPAGHITKIENAAYIVAHHMGIKLAVGDLLDEPTRIQLADLLALAVLEAAMGINRSKLTDELMVTKPLEAQGTVQRLVFSGGVSEYIYKDNVPGFGDLGPYIASAIRCRLPLMFPGLPVAEPVQGIRATVIGASQFTAQVSGNTLHIGSHDLLPQRNLQVVPVRPNLNALTEDGIRRSIETALSKAEVEMGATVALSIHWPFGPEFSLIHNLAHGIIDAMRPSVDASNALIIVLDADIGRLVGALITEHLGGYTKVLCIDGIDLNEFDYIDIGRELKHANVVTVIVKSLIFTG